MFKIIVSLLVALPGVTATGTIVCTNGIVDFNVIDTSVTPPLFTDLTSTVDLLDFPTCALNIDATIMSTPSNCDEKTAKCVKFFVDGHEVRKEKTAPYTLYGDVIGGAIDAKKPPLGKHIIKACTYSDKACTIDESGCKEMEVDFLDCDRPTAAPTVSSCDSVNEVTGFELVDTESPYHPVATTFTPPIIDLSDRSEERRVGKECRP